MDNVNLKDLYLIEIEEIILGLGERKYRATQVFTWLYRGICSFDEMTDIPLGLREKLIASTTIGCLGKKDSMESKDGTIKFLIELNDGNIIETVLMKYKHGNTVCVSTQVGCKMGCIFCASQKCGFVRNLTPGEITEQVLAIIRVTGCSVSNIVLMGIGEPFDNYENTIKAIRIFNHPKGLNVGMRHMSVSTSGIVPMILKFADERIPATLSVSLHAPNDETRNMIMPINRKYNINELLEACRYYINITNRRVTFEYALISGINESEEHARNLAKLLKGILCHVNIIPLNPIANAEYTKSTRERMLNFRDILNRKGITATIRRELGTDIEAACGQLRTRYISE